VPNKPNPRPFRDLTKAEAEQLRTLVKHPGWAIYLLRLRWAQALTLQDYLDRKDESSLGEFRGLKRAESLVEWMVVEPDPARVRAGDFEPPYEGVTAGDLENLEDLRVEED